jgi:hypothetical protein
MFARSVRTFLWPVALLTTGLTAGAAAAGEVPYPAREEKAARIIQARITDGETRLTLAPPQARPDRQNLGPNKSATPETRSLLVALPRGTTTYRLQASGAPDVQVSAPEGLLSLRGQPVLRVLATGTAQQTVELTITHDGDWSPAAPRLASSALQASLGATFPTVGTTGAPQSGSYLIIHAPDFAAAVAPLADWKTRKGYEVVTVSTAETGASTDGIKAYVQDAYDTWPAPPEYVLLVGDVDEIPTYSFYGNPSDQLYVQLDGDDWLMDAMIGRLPVENENEAQALINKTINYERHPDMAADPNWQTRALMVAGVYASDTPGYTVDFCGEQLQEMDFPAPTTVTSPPLPSLQGATVVRSTINNGVGFVVYRGWAYGTAGWDPPTFTVDDIPALETNNMTPIVMSFVCLNGDYTASTPCFGETFVRQGSGAEPGKGAVAFIGNGEHWSHTRYNDAMAISIFERIVEDGITDLGTLLNAGKLRFLDYFPNEISAAEFGEESVEFYFHIYNLMGDPSLKFWRQLPTAITVDHAANLPAGANLLPVTVTTTAGALPVAGARVGVVQNGVLIGHGLTAADGTVDIALTPVVTGSNVLVTVSEAGVSPYEGSIVTGTAGAFLAATSLSVDDSAGNGDQVVNPGETLALTATVHNHGSSTSSAFDLSIVDVSGPASSVPGQVAFSGLDGGADAEAPAPLGLVVADDAADGARIELQWDAVLVGVNHNVSTLDLKVAAPAWGEVSLAPTDGTEAQPGQTAALALTLRNTGSIATGGGTANLTLLTPTGASLGPATATIPPCAPGQTVTTDAAFNLNIDAATATATNLTFDLRIVTTEGYRTDTHCAVVVGPVNVSAPVGPDAHGYYAYDSADFDYPDSRPVYAWREISTALGGPGTKLDFPIENEVVWMVVDLPFSFQYYGQDYSQIRVSDNGWISFDTGSDYDFYNWTIPTQYGVEALVAPFWDNLNPVPPGPGQENVNGIDPDGIYTYHDTDADAFVVEWSRLPHYKPEILGLQTFQVTLLNTVSRPTLSGDGELLFSYRQVNNNDHLRMYATVGIESPDGTDGLQLSYGNVNAPGMAPLQPGLAVRVTTEPPVRVPYVLSRLDATVSAGRLSLSWTPADDRPVIGWHIDRIGAGRRERLTAAPLAGDRRSFTAPLPDKKDQDTYLLTALHPFGVVSEPGQTAITGSGVTRVALYPAHPNPAPGTTTIGFALPRQAQVRLRVYDVAGRLVRTLIDGPTTAGEGVKIWDGRSDDGGPVAGGVYFYRLETNDRTLTRKMILVR